MSLNHVGNATIHSKSLETPFQQSWGKRDWRSQGTPVRGDPATRAAVSRGRDMGGLEDRPLGQAPRLARSGGTASRGRLCRVLARVCACACACVCVGGTGGVDLQGSVSLSAEGHMGGSVFP